MINEQAIAATEVLDILSHTSEETIKKVSKEFIKYLEENKTEDYKSNIDYSIPLKEVELRESTKSLLATMVYKYLSTEEQKIQLREKWAENEKKYQEELIEKYNPNNIFSKNERKEENYIQEEVNLPAIIKKENIFIRIANMIKRLFMKKNI